MMTWGDEHDFAHFLPRIFEIVATQDFNWPGIEVLYGDLRRAGWRRWPRREQEAVEAYLQAKWRFTLATFPSTHAADDVLCAIAQAVDDVRPHLALWEADTRAAASRHLVEFVLRGLQPGTLRLTNAWWDGRDRQRQSVVEWLRSAVVEDRLTDLAIAGDGEPAGDALAAWEALATGQR